MARLIRPLALVLTFAFAAAQGVAMTDCGCGPLCGHKNACPGHDAAPDDCCKDAPEQRCSHLEPQADLLADAPALDLLPDALPLEFDAAPLRLPPALDVPLAPELPPRPQGRPIYLALHAFLI